MAKTPAQSDFVYVPPPPRDPDAPDTGASRRLTRGVYIVMGAMLLVLFVLLAIALHVPSGESP